MEFLEKKPKLARQLAEQWKKEHSCSSRLCTVRALQSIGALLDDGDTNKYLTADEIVNFLFVANFLDWEADE